LAGAAGACGGSSCKLLLLLLLLLFLLLFLRLSGSTRTAGADTVCSWATEIYASCR
jgi:hypothetical protein